ncbi:MAG TPA: NAD(P)-dependent oxidoreductase, partial [Polyangiaceae bacterium]
MKPAFPVALKLEGRSCLVVGIGDEAHARAAALEAAGAKVTRVERPFDPGDLDGMWLAVFTDRNPELAEVIALEA